MLFTQFVKIPVKVIKPLVDGLIYYGVNKITQVAIGLKFVGNSIIDEYPIFIIDHGYKSIIHVEMNLDRIDSSITIKDIFDGNADLYEMGKGLIFPDSHIRLNDSPIIDSYDLITEIENHIHNFDHKRYEPLERWEPIFSNLFSVSAEYSSEEISNMFDNMTAELLLENLMSCNLMYSTDEKVRVDLSFADHDNTRIYAKFLQLIDEYGRWHHENPDELTFPSVVENHSDIVYCVGYGINIFNNVKIRMYNKIGNTHTQINYGSLYLHSVDSIQLQYSNGSKLLDDTKLHFIATKSFIVDNSEFNKNI